MDSGQVWGHKPPIPVLRRWRQEDSKFETSLGYKVKQYLETKQNKKA
jgi:hypothetical protein